MLKRNSIITQVCQLFGHLSGRRRIQVGLLSVLMVFSSFAEVLSIGAVIPFLAIIVDPQRIFGSASMQSLNDFFKIKDAAELLGWLTCLFITAVIFAAIFRVFLHWAQTRLTLAIGADLSVSAFRQILKRPLAMHLTSNSSEVLSGLQKARDLVYFLLQPVINTISGLILFSAIFLFLIFVDVKVALTTLIGFGMIYFIIVSVSKRQVSKNSQVINSHHIFVNKTIQEGLGGVRDLVLNGTHTAYCERYRDAIGPLQAAIASNQIVAGCPKFAIEAFGVTFIAVLAYLGTLSQDPANELVKSTIPTLGALALGAQRILPILQHVYVAYVTLKGSAASNCHALDILAAPTKQVLNEDLQESLSFERAISLRNLGFRYNPCSPWVFRNVCLEISKGSRVGFIGATGSGKTTLLDILMSFLEPTEGDILVDDRPITQKNMRSWRSHLSYVPQSIFLADLSIAENIAFGSPRDLIDMGLVERAAKWAQIAETIERWEGKYGTLVGERGMQLSGGQKQRLGLARAFYKQSSVIILDEATNALDNKTEESLLEAIERMGRDITILLVAHNPTTLKNCDFIFEVSDGKLLLRVSSDQKITRMLT